MKRYMISIEADIPVLDIDLKDEDYDGINPDIIESSPDLAIELAAVNAVQRIVGHTGIQVIEAYCSGVDNR